MGFTTTQLKFFADFIQSELGIIYSPDNYFQLEKRLAEIRKQLGLTDDDALWDKAKSGLNGAFRQLLLDVATNNETSFFRDPKLFAALEAYVIPEIAQRFSRQPVLRIWSAASSYGQEPYTLAMMLAEMAKSRPGLPRFEILATDISQAALNRAKAGRFTQLEVQRGLPATHLVKYFTKGSDDMWTIKPEIRVAVQFRTQNLLDPLVTLGSFELVLCRNVLIYQNDGKKKEILAEIAKRINSGGFLALGAAESLHGLSDGFLQRLHNGAIIFEKK